MRLKLITCLALLVCLCLPGFVQSQCISGDCINGTGTMNAWVYSYTGSFVNGLREGQGLQTYFKNGADEVASGFYEGSWKKDKRNGTGKFTFPDKNSFFFGEFINDTGKGDLVFARTKTKGTLTEENVFIEDRTAFFSMVKKLRQSVGVLENLAGVSFPAFVIGKNRLASRLSTLPPGGLTLKMWDKDIKNVSLQKIYTDTSANLTVYQWRVFGPFMYDSLQIATEIPEISMENVFTIVGKNGPLYEGKFSQIAIVNQDTVISVTGLDPLASVAGSPLFNKSGKLIGVFKQLNNTSFIYSHLLLQRRSRILSAGR